MTAGEKGFLLLTSHLGDPARKVLTTAQFRDLTLRMQQAPKMAEEREIEERDLVALGYDRSMAGQILRLLEQEGQLRWYLRRGKRCFSSINRFYFCGKGEWKIICQFSKRHRRK